MHPEKSNEILKPEFLQPPPIPSDTVHLDGIGFSGVDQPNLTEHIPPRIRSKIREKYADLLRQHDAIEVAFWSIEEFSRSDPNKIAIYKEHAESLYSKGALVANPKFDRQLKFACAFVKCDLPGVSRSFAERLADQMVVNWLEGNFEPSKQKLDLIKAEIRKSKKKIQSNEIVAIEDAEQNIKELLECFFNETLISTPLA